MFSFDSKKLNTFLETLIKEETGKAMKPVLAESILAIGVGENKD